MSLTDRVAQVIRHELHAAALTRAAESWLPEPCDLDVEGEVLSAVLNGDVTTTELQPLLSRHFFAHINQAIWEAALDAPPGDLETIHRSLVARGWRGALGDEIETLVLKQPFCSLSRLRGHVVKLMNLWSQRELIGLMQQIDADMRRGVLTADEARRRFDARAREVLG